MSTNDILNDLQTYMTDTIDDLESGIAKPSPNVGMMSAKEALEVSSKVDVLNEARASLELAIRHTAEAGETFVVFSSYHSDYELFTKLENEMLGLGYEVELYYIEGEHCSNICFSWGDED